MLAIAFLLASAHLASGASPCSSTTTAIEVAKKYDVGKRVVAITGGDTGLGYETSLALATGGAEVIILAHSQEKGEKAAKRILAATGNSPRVLSIDLSSLESTRASAEALLQSTPKLDVLLNNAALATPPSTWRKGASDITADGFNQVIQVGYIGHFLLTELLMPRLREAAAGRVIQVSSMIQGKACEFAQRPADCTSLASLPEEVTTPVSNPDGKFYGAPYNVTKYGIGKRMQVFQAAEIARREAALGSRVTSVALEPGVAKTALFNSLSSPTIHKILCKGKPDCPAPPSVNAATQTYLAAVPTLPAGGNGEFYGLCEVEMSMRTAMLKKGGLDKTVAYQRGLWELSLGWAGLQEEGKLVGSGRPVVASYAAAPLMLAVAAVGLALAGRATRGVELF